MTLGEFADALSGFNDLERERLQWQLFNTRRICYYSILPHLDPKKNTIKKEQDLFPLDMDEELEKIRIKNLPVATVTFDDERPNP